jgi:hypothetical protein
VSRSVAESQTGKPFYLALALLAMLWAPRGAHAMFFSFWTERMPDGAAGATGELCVRSDSKVGDRFWSANGHVATVKSLVGTSSRCKNPAQPIRAQVELSPSGAFTAEAGINLPDGYTPQSLSDAQRLDGAIFSAVNKATDSGVFLASVQREAISNPGLYADWLRTVQSRKLHDVNQSEIEQLEVNGLNGWRFQTTGTLRNFFETSYTYLMTVLEGNGEIVTVNVWTRTKVFEKQQDEFKQIAFKIVGLNPPPQPAGEPSVASE